MEDELDNVLRAMAEDPDVLALRQRLKEQDRELDAIRAMLGANEQLQTRTQAFLAGELEAEEDMGTNDKLVSMRLPTTEMERAELLQQLMAEHKDWRGIGVTRSSVLRMALIRGLDELQEQYGTTKDD